MTEANVVIVPDDKEGELSEMSSPTNVWQAREYAEQLDKIFDDFKELLWEDREDSLTMKRHMGRMFYQMNEVNVNTVLNCMKEPTWATLWQSLDPDQVHKTDPGVYTPTSTQVLSQLPERKINAGNIAYLSLTTSALPLVTCQLPAQIYHH